MVTTTSATTKTTTTSSNAAVGSLPPAEAQHYANKLISADLPAERKKIVAQKTEAQKEGNNKLLLSSNAKLKLINDEQHQRDQLANTKLANGKPASSLVEPLQHAALTDLKQQQAALKTSTAPDAKIRLLAVNRELERREAVSDAKAAAKETARLDTVKTNYAKTLVGDTPKQLHTEQLAEHTRLTNAQTALDLAQQQLASAQTPADKAQAQTLVNQAQKNLRTEYAKAAVIDSKAPVPLDHQALHDYANTLKTKTLPQLQTERKAQADELTKLSTGTVRGTREQIANQRAKVAIVDAAIAKIAPPKPVDATRNPGNVVFNGPGMMVADASLYPASQYAAKLKAAGVSYVMLQVNNPGPVDGNIAALQAGWADQWKAAGFKVGFWGVSYGNAAQDGQLGAKLTAQYKGDFYVADCEGPFQAGEGDTSRNKAFVDAFTAEANKDGIGNIPRALSSMGSVALDMKPWIDGGWDAMPQAYWNDYQIYQPSRCVSFYEGTGWPKDRIHPTIATYGKSAAGDQTRPLQINDYIADLKAGGTTGFSYYLPENYMDDTEYQQLVAGIAGGMNGPPEK